VRRGGGGNLTPSKRGSQTSGLVDATPMPHKLPDRQRMSAANAAEQAK
jgi:hypothetical protein